MCGPRITVTPGHASVELTRTSASPSATPQSSDSPTHMIQSVDASASQKRHRSFANRVAVPGSRPLARHDAARPAHALAWRHAHREGAAAPTSTSTRRQGRRGGDRAPSAQVYVDLADVERALDHRRTRCEERTPVATEGERFRRARGATIPAKRTDKLTPRPRAELQVVLGTLDAADVGPVQIGAFGELLL